MTVCDALTRFSAQGVDVSARTAARACVTAVVGVITTVVVAPVAHADPCDLIKGPALQYCQRGDGAKAPTGGGPSVPDVTNPLDPLSSLAKGFAEAAGWTVDKLSNAVDATSTVDFTNGGFLKTYSLVFAAATFLTMLLWLWAVAKRAVRGVPLTTALGEAVGLLWLTVIASAFTPLILYVVVQAVDGITEALVGTGNSKFFDVFSAALNKNDMGGGPIVKILLALVSIVAAGAVWFELVIRTALLYVGAVMGTIVYSGLVDKQLWNRVKKYAGLMGALIMVKPIIVVVLRLASAMAGGDPKGDTVSAIVSGLAIIVIAIVSSALLFRMIPGMGDDIVAARRDAYDPASRQSLAAVTKPVSTLRQGINTHASRDSASRPSTTSSSQQTSASASSGISTHASRPTRSTNQPPPQSSNPVPRQNGSGSAGS
ncbi:hypothetical protein [Streptomyces sp. NPDC056723]|uniref:hypothetical protein n=1 Tax=Streptomyces sp. NPDC056723 TaxID=3345925 RepID=UPI0036CACB28